MSENPAPHSRVLMLYDLMAEQLDPSVLDTEAFLTAQQWADTVIDEDGMPTEEPDIAT